MSAILRSNPKPARRAMTLLEVVLAMTVLASISTLVAALWAQTRDWTIENASHQKALRVERAVALLDQQWRSRVLTVALGDAEAPAIALTHETLTFITSTPIFFHDAPMVRVVYRIAREGGYLVGESAVWSLEYEESPVNDPRVAVDTGGVGGAAQSRSLTLLDDAGALRWERWHDPPVESRRAEPARWIAVGEQDDLVVGVASSTIDQGLNDLAAAAEAARQREEIENPLRAGRLTGTIKGASFAWLFVAAPSR